MITFEKKERVGERPIVYFSVDLYFLIVFTKYDYILMI